MMQNDDVNIYDDQSDHGNLFWILNDSVKHGLKNFKVLKAQTPGLEKLTASLSYPYGNLDRKEVMSISSIYFIFFFDSLMSHMLILSASYMCSICYVLSFGECR